MVKCFLSLLSLITFATVSAETVPALVIGGQTKIALQDIVSVKPSASGIIVLKTNGSMVSENLSTLTFGTVESTEGIGSVLMNDAMGYAVYDMRGHLLKQGTSADASSILYGLNPGAYVVRLHDGKSYPVYLAAGLQDAKSDAMWNVAQLQDAAFVRPSAAANSSAASAMQIGLSGICPMTELAQVDSLTFSADLAEINVIRSGSAYDFSISDISEITFPEYQDEVTIAYDAESVEGVNSLYFDGVTIDTQGAGVTVNSTFGDEVEYELSGTSENGYFKIYSAKKWEAVLKGLTLTNPSGPVINGQSGKKGTIHSQNGYVNTLCDGQTYAESDEDQKGCIFSEGQLIFNGKGTLNVTSKYKHGICSDDYVSFENGTVNVLGAAGDAVHANDSVLIQSGTISLVSSSDGIDCDSLIIFREGENGVPVLTITNAAKDVKGVKAGTNLIVEAGTINITMTGNAGKGMKADGTITIGKESDLTGPTLTISTTGSSITQTNADNGGGWGGGGSSNRSSAKAIKSTGAAYVYGGQMNIQTTKSGAEGLESKTSVSIYGGQHYFKCYDDCINSSGVISFNGGTTVCWSNGNDAVDSNYGRSGALLIAGGNIFAYSTKGSPEEGLDCDNNSYIKITGGIAVSAGGKQGGGGGWGGGSSSSVGSSTQGYCLSSTTISYNATNYYTLCSTTGDAICTYKFGASCSSQLSLFTAPNLGKGSFTIKSGTSAPTSCTESVNDVFFITPTVETTTTFKTLTSK